jgi:hypothetical protein
MNWTSTITIISATTSAIVALIAIYISYRVVIRAEHQRQMDIHSKFQAEMRSIQKALPNDVNRSNWSPQTDGESRLLTMYWYLVFDEWFMCTKGDRTLLKLWTEMYTYGVKSALKMPAFRAEIENLLDGKSLFLGHVEEFKHELNRLCRAVHGKNLLP